MIPWETTANMMILQRSERNDDLSQRGPAINLTPTAKMYGKEVISPVERTSTPRACKHFAYYRNIFSYAIHVDWAIVKQYQETKTHAKTAKKDAKNRWGEDDSDVRNSLFTRSFFRFVIGNSGELFGTYIPRTL